MVIFSASAFVVNKDRTKMLVVYHIINDGWIYPGGYADGEDDTLPLVFREYESKGVKWVNFEDATNETMCDFIRPVHKN